jgi:glucose dehydrogenase
MIRVILLWSRTFYGFKNRMAFVAQFNFAANYMANHLPSVIAWTSIDHERGNWHVFGQVRFSRYLSLTPQIKSNMNAIIKTSWEYTTNFAIKMSSDATASLLHLNNRL